MVGNQHFNDRQVSSLRQRMGIHSQIQGATDPGLSTPIHHGLCDGQNVLLVKTFMERAATVARGAEADFLGRIVYIRYQAVIVAHQFGDINQIPLLGGLARAVMDCQDV